MASVVRIASYSGAHSFRSQAEHATSNVATIFLGYQLSPTTEVFADVESAAGGGLSDALGLAGFVNVDEVRNPELGPSPYLARAMIRQIIPLSSETIETERGPFALATSRPGAPVWNSAPASSGWLISLISMTAAAIVIPSS